MAAVGADDLDVAPQPISSFPSLDEVRHFRVDESQPPTSNAQGMDFERCSALHNAIIKHNWVATGHELSDLPRTTWTELAYNIPHLPEVEDELDGSVFEFLKRAMVVSEFPEQPHVNRLFYYSDGLSPAEMVFFNWEHFREDGINCVTLYLAGEWNMDSRDGIV
jgi:hypothetical protein